MPGAAAFYTRDDPLATHYASEAPGIKPPGERVAGRFELPWSFAAEDAHFL